MKETRRCSWAGVFAVLLCSPHDAHPRRVPLLSAQQPPLQAPANEQPTQLMTTGHVSRVVLRNRRSQHVASVSDMALGKYCQRSEMGKPRAKVRGRCSGGRAPFYPKSSRAKEKSPTRWPGQGVRSLKQSLGNFKPRTTQMSVPGANREMAKAKCSED